MDFKTLQKMVYANKLSHGFNISSIEKEFLLLYGELAEVFDAYKKR